MANYNELKPFRFWCQKILPLVYDDSLSYYELLCKVVDYLNKTIDDVNTVVSEFGTLEGKFGELKSYVDWYFDNLDVQEEINNKLDQMAADGSLTDLIADYVDPLIAAQNAQIQAFITQITGRMDEQDAYNAVTRGMLSQAYGAPTPFDNIDDVPDGVGIYVYIGTTTATFTAGHWYYIAKDTAEQFLDIVDGGVYQAAALQTDTTLTITGMAADAKATGDKIAALKTDLELITEEEYMQYDSALPADIWQGAVRTASYARTVYKNITGLTSVTVTKQAGRIFTIGFSTNNPTNGTVLSNVITDNTADIITADVPSGANYVAAYVWNSNVDTLTADEMLATVKINPVLSAIDVVARNDISMLDDYIDNINKNTDFRAENATQYKTANLFDGVLYDGYMSANGTVYEGNYKYTSPIDVHDHIGDTITAYNLGLQKYLRFVCVLNESGTVVESLGTNTNALTYTVPVGAYYIIISFVGASVTSPYMMVSAINETIYVPHNNDWLINKYKPVVGDICIPKPEQMQSASLANTERLTGSENSVKRLGTYILYCKPGVLTDDNYIIMGKNGTMGYAVGVSATKWAWFINDVYQGGGTHGLTIKDYLMIVVNKIPETGTVLTIYTNGGTYTRTNTSWADNHGAPYVFNNSGATITDVKMTWASAALRSRNWFFGDSYVSIATTRWPKYIYDLGFGDNLLINGYPGEQSQAGYSDLLNCIKLGMPSLMAWCFGMNDADSGSINATWLAHVNAFLEICRLYNITPILATIPCCPLADHQYKNAWVRSSGYRYIDFASAVNVSQDSSTWYTGMLSNDNIHPTEQGAIALATQVLVDVPELLIK